MPKYAKRKDGNQAIIEDALTKAGYTWEDLSKSGDGLPDLLVLSKRFIFVLLEVKNKGGKVTPREREFHEKFRGGALHIAKTPEAALDVMAIYD